MANPILRGTKTPQVQEWTQTFDPRRGLRSSFEMKGIDIGQMSTQAEAYMLQGYRVSLSCKYGIASMTVASPDGTVPGTGSGAQTIVDKWEVGVDQEKPSLFENQNFLGYAMSADASFGTTVHSQLFAAIQDCANLGSPTSASWNFFLSQYLAKLHVLDANGIPLASGALLIDAFNGVLQQLKPFVLDYLRGSTNYVHSKYMLRHTTNAPNNYSGNVADFNVEKIYTIAELLSEAQDPTLWVLPLPAYLAYKILNYPVPVNMPFNFLFGGLKLRSNAITTARNRIEIVQEYLIDAWPIHTYGTI